MQVSSPRQIASRELRELENVIEHSTGHLWENITPGGRAKTLKIHWFYQREKNVNSENFWILKLNLAPWKKLELTGFKYISNCEKKKTMFFWKQNLSNAMLMGRGRGKWKLDKNNSCQMNLTSFGYVSSKQITIVNIVLVPTKYCVLDWVPHLSHRPTCEIGLAGVPASQIRRQSRLVNSQARIWTQTTGNQNTNPNQSTSFSKEKNGCW